MKECKRLWIIWLLRLACYFHRGRNSFFSVKNHIYSPVKVVAVKVSSNSPGPVGRDCKRFYWKRVQSKRISIVWLLYLKETPCSIKPQREITFQTQAGMQLHSESPSLRQHYCICKPHLCKHENQCNNSMYKARPTALLMSPCWTYTLSLRALRGFAVGIKLDSNICHH